MSSFSAKAFYEAKAWNKKYPLCTLVKVKVNDQEWRGATSSEAFVDGDKVVVMVDLVPGFHELKDVTPIAGGHKGGR